MPSAGTHCTVLSTESHLTAGKLKPSSIRDQLPEGESRMIHSFDAPHVHVSPVVSAGGYRLSGTINGVELSLLLDTAWCSGFAFA